MAAGFENCWLPGCAIMFAKPAWFIAAADARKWVASANHSEQDCYPTSSPARIEVPAVRLPCTRDRRQEVLCGRVSR